ncbi:sugar ABC transporter ATP-binding protein [Petroclostridium sp. X23]|uniref:sugar ABC transporter ATP-binding protein n=1 Tax=Petroclostridium sp. X23 TaxID=3045146 RepID=UPI0024AE7B1B|nr:sugar ABC transporter ATP-binding protein [Petroclostridium sp. X23]WHH58509.1 sugar ABC transporter ATP-binding protein [Petroclostridium sp. X23]
MSEKYRIEMENISKSFGGVHALKDVTFSVKPGEIHALVGENGAGKSTLMKILSGAYQKDSGVIRIDGKQVNINNPHKGKELGIGIIYQEFALAPHLTVAENIFINRMGNRRGIMNWRELYSKADELIKSIGFNISSRTIVNKLSVAFQQVVEITKALSQNVKVLILDEPTAVLAPREAERLFEILFKLKEQGVSIIYISHRLDEIFKISDRITAMKDGCVTGTVFPHEVSTDDVISLMIGRKLSALFPKRECVIGEELFRVEGLNSDEKVNNVSFSVRKGEVVGLAGLVGSGRTEIARAIFGADAFVSGKVFLKGQELKIKTPKQAVKYGIGLLPESRKEQGVILTLPIRYNVTMSSLKKITGIAGLIKKKKEKADVHELIEKLTIKTRSTEEYVANLSGGNQQKVAFAKWVNADCEVIILDEPTRGVDVGAKVEIYCLINELAARGVGIIMISSELMEIIGMCDRILVVGQGSIKGELSKGEFSEESIMKMAIGGKQGE